MVLIRVHIKVQLQLVITILEIGKNSAGTFILIHPNV